MQNETRAMILKRRARKPLALGMAHGFAVYPNGCGGISDSNKCYSFSVGDHVVILTETQWNSIVIKIKELDDGT